MESKKLQQLQQANSHLAPQPMPQTKAPSFHSGTSDYRPSHSPVFQNYNQYHSVAPNFGHIRINNQQPGPQRYHHQTTLQSASQTPQSQHQSHHIGGHSQGNSHLHVKQLQTSHGVIVNYSPQEHIQQQLSPQYGSDQVYQNNMERIYTQAPLRSIISSSHPHNHPVSQLQQQYQELQQAKIQQQIQTQNEALIQQQRTFALRQQLNPPVPQTHFHIQNSSQPQHQLHQQPPRNIPPSTLNLTNQFQPAAGPVNIIQNDGYNIYGSNTSQKLNIQCHKSQNQAIYQHNQQVQQQMQQNKANLKSPSEQTPIIQQNHPGLVVNQACQTQLSGTVSKAKTPGDSPSHQSLDRKKSTGTIQSLKSPVTKRPASAPVTLSGWLYKQGSDGLKVWRKRWFVLSEYCLFYYKGMEEEKLLGSILLPSYTVSACSTEDKIYRKFAFKCEHQNMRTYWLAAETPESMGQWIRALTAATMMQGSSESDQLSQPSVSSLNPSGENSDSGIHTYQSQQSKLSVMPSHGPVTPISDGGASNSGVQPLYANAPPKPRRANDGGYSSPSPENSIERYDGNFDNKTQPDLTTQQARRRDIRSPAIHTSDPIYNTRQPSSYSIRQSAKSPDPVASLRMQQLRLENNATPNPNRSLNKPQYGPEPSNQEMQRLYSPESYHGSKDNILRAQQRFDDYGNKIYGGQGDREMYVQHLTPTGATSNQHFMSAERRTPDTYGRSRNNPAIRTFADYEDIYQMGKQMNQSDSSGYRRPISPPGYISNKHIPNMPERYIPSHLDMQNQNIQQVQMRPRTVQPIPRPHSADFLEYEARHVDTSYINPEATRAPRPKSSLDINRTPDNFYYSEASYAEKMRQSALYLQKPSQQLPQSKVGSMYLSPTNASHKYSGSSTIPRDTDFDQPNRYHFDNLNPSEMSSSVPRTHRPYSRSMAFQQQEQFLRSASARLPRKEDDGGLRDGERKREESMKRLLEWKQKMLQSPLTRKGVPISIAMDTTSPLQNVQIGHGIQRSRSETHANCGYNSYSSDDEASISVQNVCNNQKPHLQIKGNASVTDINRNSQTNNNNPFYITENHIQSNHHQDIYFEKDNRYDLGKEQQQINLAKSSSHRDLDLIEREREKSFGKLNVSAGDLLSRTHEELVLLLIQLRRQNSSTARAIEQCCTDIHDVQNRLRSCNAATRAENIARLDHLKQHLVDLEKQYEKSKPLVNLVDNMVKLGSLYRNGSAQNIRQVPPETVTLDRLEFNQRVQERRLLQEERKQWDRLSPSQNQLQSKVQQLYQLDQLLQEESGTLQSLQRDKEDLERALGGLKKRLQDGNGPPLALEAARKQQHALERELSRVHQLLAENSKKLEQTVAGNARLEQELLVLRQKLQASRGSRDSQSALGSQGTLDNMQYGNGTTAVLESELRRVQQLVGDMQRQRQELSQAVRQLTENSNSLYQQIRPKDNLKKRMSSTWAETDLDSMITTDHGTSSSGENLSSSKGDLSLNSSYSGSISNIANLSIKSNKQLETDIIESSGLDSDDLLEQYNFGNLSNIEKQEIKTVRIVKRESERRHRERGVINNIINSNQNLDHVQEEESQFLDDYNRSKSLPRAYIDSHEPFLQTQHDKRTNPLTPVQPSSIYGSNPSIPVKYTDYYNDQYPVSLIERPKDNFNSTTNSYMNIPNQSTNPFSNYLIEQQQPSNNMNLRHKTESVQSLTKTIGDLSPVFQSEAAKQIIIEMSGNTSEENSDKIPLANKHRRVVPKEKRRHYTAPNTINAKIVQDIQTENDMNKNNTNWRARDDLDMEVALRPRINAPDVVRSALDQQEKISENSIDKLFAAPSKIIIPERYIPEQPPELSPEEKKRRQEKVEAIKKMLAEAPLTNDTSSLPPSQINAEKKQREHLLQLNQILAQQVMQMSKIVAERAMAALPKNHLDITTTSLDDRSSPITPLPIYQQRDNFFS